MYQKNQEFEIEIEDMTEDGSGLGKVDGFPFFVKDTVVGDRVRILATKVKKTYGYGKVLAVLSPSKDRVIPRCPVSRRCGGCQLQAMSYESQLQFKRRKVENHMRRIGGLDVTVQPVIGMEEPWRYRNKTQVPVGLDRNGKLTMGFYAAHSHEIVEEADCALGCEENQRILSVVRAFLQEHRIPVYQEETHKGLVRHVLMRRSHKTGEHLVCIVINGQRLPEADQLVQRLLALAPDIVIASISININTEKSNVILGEQVEHLYGPGYLVDHIGPMEYQISPQSFFQVNPEQTEKLYNTALRFAGLTGTEQVWDLYCGIGTISLFLAQKAGFVRGVEIVPPAISDAQENAKRNHLTNTRFYVGKAEEVLPAVYREEHCKADVIVVDPPRKGLEPSVIETIVAMEPDRIVYVACDSATLARDLKQFTAGGYEVQIVQPVDMFPQTVHVETVCLLSNRKPDTKVEIEIDMEEYYRIKDGK